MNDIKQLLLADIEIIKALAATTDTAALYVKMNDETKSRICEILCKYHKENINSGSEIGWWTKKFVGAGIDEDSGKAAIACARRMGADVS